MSKFVERRRETILKWQKVLGIVTLSSVLIVPTVQASTLQQKLSQYQKQYGQYKNQYSQQKQQESDSQKRIAGLQQSIKTLNNSLTSDKANIAKQQQQLDTLNKQQKELDAKKQARIKELSAFLKSNYENGSYTYLAVLIDAHSWSDLIGKIDEVGYVVKHYRQLQDDIKNLNTQIASQKVEIQQKTVALQNDIQQKEATQSSVQQAMAKEQTMMNQLSVQQKATLSATSTTQNQIAYVQEMIKEQELDAQMAKERPITSGGSSGPTITAPIAINGSVGSLIAYAESFIGTPYVWGGTSPSGFDCSGYTQYVFKHFGVYLPRVSQDQFHVGVPVSSSQLQPGDLVFFSTYGPGATHVGIYVGNGNMVNAEGHGVMVTGIFGNAYWGPRYIGARRVLK